MIRKLAKSGRKGRKHDTRLLNAVVALSFAFITIATILLASLEATEDAQTHQLYGSWQFLHAGAKNADVEAYAASSYIDELAVSRILYIPEQGAVAPTGVVGTLNDALLAMGSIRLMEGRFPTEPGEMVIEANQLGRYPSGVGVGSTITTMYYVGIAVPPREVDESASYSLFRFLPTVTEDEIEEYRQSYKEWLEKMLSDPAYRASAPLDYLFSFTDTIDDIDRYYNPTESSYYFYEYLRHFHSYPSLPVETRASFIHSTNEPHHYGDTDMLLVTEYDISYYPSDYGSETAFAEAIEDGIPLSQTLRLEREYTITGIVETYTDRWDGGGSIPLPNTFVSEADATDINDAVESIEEHLLSESYSLGNNLVLARSNALGAGELYQKFVTFDPYYLVSMVFDEPEMGEGTDPIYRIAGVLEETGESVELLGSVVTYIPSGREYVPVLSIPFGGEEHLVPLDTLMAGAVSISGILPFQPEMTPQNAYENLSPSFRVNAYAYPLEPDTSATLTLLIVGVIFITTVCAVFQIFLTQLNRRARRMTLMKSVGATNAQIAELLFWEAVYLLLFALPVGALCGFALAFAGIRIANAVGAANALLFTINWTSLSLGLLSGVLAVFLGMLVPLVRAIHTPLVGRMNAKPRRATRHIKTKRSKMQTFARVCLRNLAANRTRTIGTLALCTFIITIELVCVFLAFSAFGEYDRTVVRNNKPDYMIEAPYGVSVRTLPNYIETYSGPDGIARIETYKLAEQIYLSFEGMGASPILSAADESRFLVPTADTYRGGDAPGRSYITNAYGIDVDAPLMDRIANAVTEGKADVEALRTGEDVVLLIPMYKTGLRETAFSFAPAEAVYYDADTAIRVGDAITLAGLTQTIVDQNIVTSLQTIQARVGAIIRYFPEEGIWPFSDECEPYTVLSGYPLITSIYRNASATMTAKETERHRSLVSLYYRYCTGKTVFYSYATEDSTRLNSFLPLLTATRDAGMTIVNYRDSSETLYAGALNTAMLTALLGVAISMIATVILGNTIASIVRQESRRTGVLQAMGVTSKRFRAQQSALAALYSLAALVIANLVIALIILIKAAVQNASLDLTARGLAAYISQTLLWHYPWWVHAAICAVFFLVVFLLHHAPLKAVVSRSPIENIRS